MSHYFPTRDEMSPHTVFGNVQLATFVGEHLQFSLADIPDGGVISDHSHINEQMGIVLAGTCRFTIGGETKLLKTGDVFRIPGGVVHSVVAVDGPAKALDVFYPIREDYR